jgi:hypothetical protein
MSTPYTFLDEIKERQRRRAESYQAGIQAADRAARNAVPEPEEPQDRGVLDQTLGALGTAASAAGTFFDLGNRFITRPAIGFLAKEVIAPLELAGVPLGDSPEKARAIRDAPSYTAAFREAYKDKQYTRIGTEIAGDPLNLVGIGLPVKAAKAYQAGRLAAEGAMDAKAAAALARGLPLPKGRGIVLAEAADEVANRILAAPVAVPWAVAKRAQRRFAPDMFGLSDKVKLLREGRYMERALEKLGLFEPDFASETGQQLLPLGPPKPDARFPLERRKRRMRVRPMTPEERKLRNEMQSQFAQRFGQKPYTQPGFVSPTGDVQLDFFRPPEDLVGDLLQRPNTNTISAATVSKELGWPRGDAAKVLNAWVRRGALSAPNKNGIYKILKRPSEVQAEAATRVGWSFVPRGADQKLTTAVEQETQERLREARLTGEVRTPTAHELRRKYDLGYQESFQVRDEVVRNLNRQREAGQRVVASRVRQPMTDAEVEQQVRNFITGSNRVQQTTSKRRGERFVLISHLRQAVPDATDRQLFDTIIKLNNEGWFTPNSIDAQRGIPGNAFGKLTLTDAVPFEGEGIATIGPIENGSFSLDELGEKARAVQERLRSGVLDPGLAADRRRLRAQMQRQYGDAGRELADTIFGPVPETLRADEAVLVNWVRNQSGKPLDEVSYGSENMRRAIQAAIRKLGLRERIPRGATPAQTFEAVRDAINTGLVEDIVDTDPEQQALQQILRWMDVVDPETVTPRRRTPKRVLEAAQYLNANHGYALNLSGKLADDFERVRAWLGESGDEGVVDAATRQVGAEAMPQEQARVPEPEVQPQVAPQAEIAPQPEVVPERPVEQALPEVAEPSSLADLEPIDLTRGVPTTSDTRVQRGDILVYNGQLYMADRVNGLVVTADAITPGAERFRSFTLGRDQLLHTGRNFWDIVSRLPKGTSHDAIKMTLSGDWKGLEQALLRNKRNAIESEMRRIDDEIGLLAFRFDPEAAREVERLKARRNELQQELNATRTPEEILQANRQSFRNRARDTDTDEFRQLSRPAQEAVRRASGAKRLFDSEMSMLTPEERRFVRDTHLSLDGLKTKKSRNAVSRVRKQYQEYKELDLEASRLLVSESERLFPSPGPFANVTEESILPPNATKQQVEEKLKEIRDRMSSLRYKISEPGVDDEYRHLSTLHDSLLRRLDAFKSSEQILRDRINSFISKAENVESAEFAQLSPETQEAVRRMQQAYQKYNEAVGAIRSRQEHMAAESAEANFAAALADLPTEAARKRARTLRKTFAAYSAARDVSDSLLRAEAERIIQAGNAPQVRAAGRANDERLGDVDLGEDVVAAPSVLRLNDLEQRAARFITEVTGANILSERANKFFGPALEMIRWARKASDADVLAVARREQDPPFRHVGAPGSVEFDAGEEIARRIARDEAEARGLRVFPQASEEVTPAAEEVVPAPEPEAAPLPERAEPEAEPGVGTQADTGPVYHPAEQLQLTFSGGTRFVQDEIDAWKQQALARQRERAREELDRQFLETQPVQGPRIPPVEAPDAYDSVGSVVDRIARETGRQADDPEVVQVREILTEAVGDYPEQFQAFELWEPGEFREAIERAFAEPDTARETLSLALRDLGLTMEAAGILSPVFRSLARLPGGKRPVERSRAFGGTGVLTREEREALEHFRTSELGVKLEQNWRKFQDTVTELAAEINQRNPLSMPVGPLMTVGDVLRLVPYAKQSQRNVILSFLRAAHINISDLQVGTADGSLRVLSDLHPNMTEEERLVRAAEYASKPGSIVIFAAQDRPIGKAAREGAVIAYQKQLAKEMGIKWDEKPRGLIADLPKAWREQALLSVRRFTVNVLDMSVKSAIFGINPLVPKESAEMYAQRYGIAVPEEALMGGEATALVEDIPASWDARVGRFLAGFNRARQAQGVRLRDLPSEFQAVQSDVALERLLPGRLGRWAGLAVRFDRYVNRGVENAFRKAAWRFAHQEYMEKLFLPRFRKEVERLLPPYLQAREDVLRQLDLGPFTAEQLREALQRGGADADTVRSLVETWRRGLDEASQRGVDMSNKIHFPIEDERVIEERLRLSSWLPFHWWATRNIPFYLDTLAANPLILRIWQTYDQVADEDRKERGLTSRFTGMLGTRLGFMETLFGRDGMVYFNPMVALSIADQTRPRYISADAPAYGKVLNLVGAAGISPAPWVQIPLTMVGVYGADAEAPGLLRTSGMIESFTGVNPERLTLIPQIVDRGQRVLLGKRSTTLTGSHYRDYEINKRIAELSIEETGRANHPDYLRAMNDPTSPIYRRAERDVRRAQQIGSVWGFFAPIPMKFLSDTEAGIRASAAGLPERLPDEVSNQLANAGHPATGYWNVADDNRAAQIYAALAMSRGRTPHWSRIRRYEAQAQYPSYAEYLNWLQTRAPGADTGVRTFLSE